MKHEIAYGLATNLVDPIDLHKANKAKTLEVSSVSIGNPLGGQALDLEWFKFAAKAYNISPIMTDYLLVPYIIFNPGLPNRNGVGFALEDLARFSVEHGQQYYKTWKGKPTFYEHQHDNPLEANGVILDTFLKKNSKSDVWDMIVYIAYDRTKYKDLIERVASRDLNTVSMGAYVTGGYTCSLCGKPFGHCTHLDRNRPHEIREFNTGKDAPELAFRVGRNPVGFETSLVETPAFSHAENSIGAVPYLKTK